MEPGEVGPRHSHDLGDEIFLILEGQCEFEIEGELAVLGPGQLCFARVNQMHGVRVVGDEPMTMFLTVTPHIEPTHTFWSEDGHKRPPVYGISTKAERDQQPADERSTTSMINLANRFRALADQLTATTNAHSHAQRLNVERFGDALSQTPADRKAALDAIWTDFSTLYAPLRAIEAVWNELAVRVADELLDEES